MATYEKIKCYVRQAHDINVETCHIAHVMSDHGLTTKTAPNRIDPLKRKKPCPNGKRKPIENALRHFGMIS